jgi:hypothetical protein
MEEDNDDDALYISPGATCGLMEGGTYEHTYRHSEVERQILANVRRQHPRKACKQEVVHCTE